MTPPPLIARHLDDLRQAIAVGNQLRFAGGDAIKRSLQHLDREDIRKATQEIAPLLDGSRLCDLAHFLMALILDMDKDRALALAALETIIDMDEAGYDALCLTGNLYADWQKPSEGCRAYDRAIALAPHASHAFLRRGTLHAAAGDFTAAIADLERATLLQPNLVDAHIALANQYRDASMANAAIATYRKALAIDPDNLDAAIGLDTAVATIVPPWHGAMLNDTRRNDLYEAAIARAVKPGSHVLDIGTGTGLLAMMAARAGAAHVTACESAGALADTARAIVDRNGLSGRITVVAKQSTGLVIGEDLPQPADILITEIFDTGLLNEGCLETISDARTRLLSPDAVILPARATVVAAPIQCPAIAAERHVTEAAGFDVTPFNALAPRQYIQTDLSRYDWQMLAPPASLFHFDFSRDGADGAESEIRLVPIADGTAHAVALWFSLVLDDAATIATGPMDPPTHWRQAVCALNPPVEFKQNEPVILTARHNGRKILVDVRT